MNKRDKKIDEVKGKSPKRASGVRLIIYNVLSVVVLLFLLNLLVSKNPGYHWMWNSLLKGGLHTVQTYKHYTTAQKNEARQGFLYTYLNYINQHTPEHAIILMPPDSIIHQLEDPFKMKILGDRRKTSYFIYPRRAVYEKHRTDYDSLYLDRITHVAIVNYHGYEKLGDDVNHKERFAIIPISKNQTK